MIYWDAPYKIRCENISKFKDEINQIFCLWGSCFNYREREIIKERYCNNKTLKEVAKRFFVTVERIRQIELKTIRKLDHYTEIWRGRREEHGLTVPYKEGDE